MTIEEGFSVQRGMNFNIPEREYGIILMSVRKNAPYADCLMDDGATIIYEGHDMPANYCPNGLSPKKMDQPIKLPSGKLTENGKFYEAAKSYCRGDRTANKIKVYEKNQKRNMVL